MVPGAFGGHDILVTHEDQRPAAAFSFPEKQQVSVDLRFLKLRMNPGEQAFKLPVKRKEFLPLVFPGNRDRFTADHPGKLSGVQLSPLRIRSGNVRGPPGRDQEGPDQGDQEQEQQQADER